MLALLAALFLLVTAVSRLIPPFQSPDEFYHLQRAYLLAHGKVILGQSSGMTGGRFDTGLLDYMRNFQDARWFAHDNAQLRALASPQACLATTIEWSGTSRFERVPNTAVYFPLPYAPQALALLIGERSGLTISKSYHLARLFSLIAALALLWCALIAYPVPPFVLALFVTPMTLVQLGSASLDAVSFATCVLAAALFSRGCDRRCSFGPGLHVALFACLLTLATSRTNLIVLTLLPAILYLTRRERAHVMSSAVLVMLALAWTVFAQRTVNSGNGHDPVISRALVYYYTTHLDALLQVLIATITNPDALKAYWQMFVGVTGWAGFEVLGRHSIMWVGGLLDSRVYAAWAVLLPLLAALSLQRRRTRLIAPASLALVIGAMTSCVLLFLIELVTWTPHPATLIAGVQGRYFTPLLILCGFAVFNGEMSPIARRAVLGILLVLTTVSIVGLSQQLLQSYWSVDPSTEPTAVTVQAANCGRPFVEFWFDLPAQDPCKRDGLLISSALRDTATGRELCTAIN
jgi:uncharacterized membrane protein